MKKLLAVLAAAAFVVGCSSENPSVDNTNLVVVKHKTNSSSVAKKKHHKKHANVSSAKMGS